MVKKLGKRSRKAKAIANRTKGIKDKISAPDIITKLLCTAEYLRTEDLTEKDVDEQIAFNNEQLKTHRYVGKHRGKGKWLKRDE